MALHHARIQTTMCLWFVTVCSFMFVHLVCSYPLLSSVNVYPCPCSGLQYAISQVSFMAICSFKFADVHHIEPLKYSSSCKSNNNLVNLFCPICHSEWFRRISHSLNVFSLYDGEKEYRGYTLFSHLITMEKKSVGYVIKFPPY